MTKRRIISDVVLEKIQLMSTRCRVICLSVPYRINSHEFNKTIYRLNCKLYNLFNTLDVHHCFIDLNYLLNAKDRTRDGLHITFRGRTRICRYVSNLLTGVQSRNGCKTSNLITIICSDGLGGDNLSSTISNATPVNFTIEAELSMQP